MSTPWVDLPFAAAVRFLLAKQPMTKEEFAQLDAEERAKAFTVAGIAKIQTIQDVLDGLQEAAAVGKTLDQFMAEFEFTGLSQGQLETIYRTGLQSAFGLGRWEQGTDPAIGDAFWGWRYRTVQDERVRPSHAALDLLVFAKGAADEVFPPWGFNCRCAAEWITNPEARDSALTSDEIPSEAMDDLMTTSFSSPALGAEFSPDLGSYDSGLVAEFIAGQRSEGQ